LEYNTSVISGFLSIAFLIENSEECSLPFLIVTMTIPVILEECVYVLNAIRGQCFESLCWNTGLTGRLIVGEFSDMLLYLSDRRTRTQNIKSGALGNVIEDGEINRCVITIVHFVTVCTEDLKVCCRCGGNVASSGITKVEVLRRTVMSGGALFQHADSFPCFFGTTAHGMFTGLDSKLVEISFFGLSLNAVVTTMGCVPVVLVGISTISKEAFARTLCRIT
jgi:hypothetical protein